MQGRLSTCYSPVRHSAGRCKHPPASFDLHVLSTPPAFILSQDQTLKFSVDLPEFFLTSLCFSLFLFPRISIPSKKAPIYLVLVLEFLSSNFQGWFFLCCSIIKVLRLSLTSDFLIIALHSTFVNNFFKKNLPKKGTQKERSVFFSDYEGNKQFLVFCAQPSNEWTGRPFKEPAAGRHIGSGCGKCRPNRWQNT